MWKIKGIFKKKKILIITLTFFLLLSGSLLTTYLFARHTYNKDILETKPTQTEEYTSAPETTDEYQLPEETEKDYGIESNIVNVLLIGVDARESFEDSRTDSIIVATMDPSSKKIKLTSFMRDMYVQIPGKGYNKINSAFQFGGVELLKKTIKYNFGLNVDNYVAIDFKGFQSMIDTLNGVTVEVKDYEVNEINKYINDVNGSNSTLLQGAGLQLLNGQQALSYCRIRKVGNNDYERTERQRRVLSLLLDKIKDTKVTSYPKLYTSISPYIKSNIPFDLMLKLVYTIYKFNGFTTEGLRIPVDNHFKDTYIDSSSVLIPELKYNASEIYKFIYNTVPKNLTVPDNSKVYNYTKETENSGSTVISTPTPQPTASSGIAATPSAVPSSTPEPTSTITPAPTPTPKQTAAPTPSASVTPSPSAGSPTPTPVSSPVASPS